MRNQNIYCFILMFLLGGCTSAMAQTNFLRASLDGYCTSKSQHVLQTNSIPLPEHDRNSGSNWDGLDVEALADAYSQNKASTKLGVDCKQLIPLSEEDIQLGFNNKPKLPFDSFLNEEWAGFYEKYPNAKGVIRVSQPGYSKDHSYAVIYIVSTCGPLCGFADFVQYKNINGSWTLDKRVSVARS